jgi:hypothetical protein
LPRIVAAQSPGDRVAEFWDEALPVDMLTAGDQPLSREEVDALWSMFRAISVHWQMEKIDPELMRSRWLDMLEARCSGQVDFRGEYRHAAEVWKLMVDKLTEPIAVTKLFTETVVTKEDQAKSRIAHVKFYVANDFIRCFVAKGGFRGFVEKARNHTGFMGGSRFREWPPVRTGGRR